MNNRQGRKTMTRRDFLKAGGAGALALTLSGSGIFSQEAAAVLAKAEGKLRINDYGPLIRDPNGILDLPQDFQYRILSREGDALDNGAPVPGAFDGMAAFPGPHGAAVLVRNHELSYNAQHPVQGNNPYDKETAGGTTALIVDSNRNVIREYVSSSGTVRNCAGGGTPWGTWLTCEETHTDGHGYVFEVNPDDPENELSKTPIRDMGFFSHEACDVDPATGIVYLTEDAGPSFLYRFLPDDRSQKPGALQKGGKLQAAAFEENVSGMQPGNPYTIVWKDLNPEDAHDEARQKGCIRFNRLEGSYFAGGAFWFDDTSGGEKRLGQIYRYIPATNTLELFYEAADEQMMQSPDNICITPWGDIWFVEDGAGTDRIMGITPEGHVYPFAQNRLNDSELAGPTFSPDGQTFFVNIQSPGITLAVWGPFANPNAARQRKMNHANPPKQLMPKISNESAAFAERCGVSVLEAAALERHGVPMR